LQIFNLWWVICFYGLVVDKQYNLYIYDCIKRYKTYPLHSELVVNQAWG